MSKKLVGSIDLNKIEKARIIKGEKGNYYSIEIKLHDEPDTYGNLGMIATGLTKEEREVGKQTGNWAKTSILGNIKFVFDNDSNGGNNASAKPVAASVSNDDDFYSLPF